MLIPVRELVPLGSSEDTYSNSLEYGQHNRGYSYMRVSATYTFWRNPRDRSGPLNSADIKKQMRRAVYHILPWPRRMWLVKQVVRMRYPQLWHAMRATWRCDPSELASVRTLLVGMSTTFP